MMWNYELEILPIRMRDFVIGKYERFYDRVNPAL